MKKSEKKIEARKRTATAVPVHVRKDDDVVVISGAHQGKSGKILKVFPKTGRIIVEGVNLVKRHTRPTQTKQGGILEKEAPIHASNVKKVG
jgi:large subunit ribosomal protein L24